MLTADDDKAQIIHTFRGDQLSTFIHEVPNNSVIVDNGNILHVIYDNTRILTIIDDSRLISTPQSSVSALSTTCGGFPYPAKYIQGTESPIISSPGQFSADWSVPSSPTQWKPYIHATPVAIWDGLYGCIEGDPDTTLLQPVLEWFYYDAYMPSYPTSPEWTMSTWYLWGNGQTIIVNNTPVTYIHSSRITGISPGIPIRGWIRINDAGYDAIGTIMDNRPDIGSSSTLYLTQNTAPERMPTQNLIATVVLEGWDIDHYNKYLTSQYLPGPVTFKNFVLTNHDDINLIPTTSMTSFVNYPYWDQNNFTDSGNLTVYNRWPTDITLVNNPDRVNPPVANFNALVTSGHGTTSVPFRDLSTGSPFLWLWNFGDGSSSTDQNPTHTYSIPGSFTVNLTVWNAGGINSLVRPNYISIIFVPVPGSS